ncbi:MAG: ABC transporter permease [Chloroflexota bacterium]
MNANDFRATLRIFWNSFILQSKENALSQSFAATLFFQPVIFTLISVSTYLYGNKPDLGLYAITGTGLISIWNNNLFTSSEIIRRERRLGTLSLVMATPTALPLILLGKSFANALTSILAMGITFATGSLVSHLPIGIADPMAFFTGLIFIVFSITCLGLIFGSLFIITRNAGEFVSVANFPVYILSGLSIPLTLLPFWARPLSNLLTPTWGNIILNQAASHVGANMFINYAWMIGLSMVYLIIAGVLYKRVEYLALRAGTLEQW